MKAAEIARTMAQSAPEIAMKLLPGGKRVGKEWCCGDLRGEHGDSLKVRLEGTRAGVWSDFADDAKGGDLLNLWAAVYRIDISQAMKEVCDYLGIRQPQPNAFFLTVALVEGLIDSGLCFQ